MTRARNLVLAHANIVVQESVKHQTITGWEMVAWAAAANTENPTVFNAVKNQLFDGLVNDIGINRLRLGVKSGAENTVDYFDQYEKGQITYDVWRANRYATVNDNSSSGSLNMAGFHFTELDQNITKIVLPIKQRLEANGEKLHINLEYVAFTGQITTGQYHHANAAEYAEFMLAVFTHLKQTHGLTPDSLEVLLEPDNVSQWTGTTLGNAIVATANQLKASGFQMPPVVAPCTANMTAAATYFDQMIAVAGAKQYLSEVCYHRYKGVSSTALNNLVTRAKQNGLKTSMLEWWSGKNTVDTLFEDLTAGGNSAWQQASLLNMNSQNGIDAYYVTNPTTNPQLTMASKTQLFRQYYKWVRMGAQRVEATSDNASFKPVAFINMNQARTVVVNAKVSGTIAVAGLPAGKYHLNYSSATKFDVKLADVTVSAGQSVTAAMPEVGVITIYGDAGGGTGTGGTGGIGGSGGTGGTGGGTSGSAGAGATGANGGTGGFAGASVGGFAGSAAGTSSGGQSAGGNGAKPTDGSDDSGCTCRATSKSTRDPLGLLALFGLIALSRRRRR